MNNSAHDLLPASFAGQNYFYSITIRLLDFPLVNYLIASVFVRGLATSLISTAKTLATITSFVDSAD